MKKEEKVQNKYEFGAFIIRHWVKAIGIIFAIGIVVFILQIKTVKIGDMAIEKQSLKTQYKK